MNQLIIKQVREKKPLIHCITNYVTAHDVANMLLAAGGSPIMAAGRLEVEDITSICQGLVINIGTLDERNVESMTAAGKKAGELGHPIVFDPVGAGASVFRTETARKIIREIPCTVIRGNVSEIKTIADISTNTQGVDANEVDVVTEENLNQMCMFTKELSEKTGAIIAMTGAIDLVASPDCVFVIRNGHFLMTKITGAGCMLDGIIAAYVCCNPQQMQKATAAAIAAEGICAEKAYELIKRTGGGTASFLMHLIDAMSNFDDEQLKGGAKIEIR